MKDDHKKDIILKAAMALLVEKDINKITTREVVEKANVNISLLHYYFKTKNELFSAALIASTDGLFRNWVTENINLQTPTVKDLENYLAFIIESIHLYPSISRSKVYMILQGVDINTLSFGISKDLYVILSHLLTSTQEEIQMKIHLLSQIILSLRTSTDLIKSHTKLDFNLEVERKSYIKKVLYTLFPELY